MNKLRLLIAAVLLSGCSTGSINNQQSAVINPENLNCKPCKDLQSSSYSELELLSREIPYGIQPNSLGFIDMNGKRYLSIALSAGQYPSSDFSSPSLLAREFKEKYEGTARVLMGGTYTNEMDGLRVVLTSIKYMESGGKKQFLPGSLEHMYVLANTTEITNLLDKKISLRKFFESAELFSKKRKIKLSSDEIRAIDSAGTFPNNMKDSAWPGRADFMNEYLKLRKITPRDRYESNDDYNQRVSSFSAKLQPIRLDGYISVNYDPNTKIINNSYNNMSRIYGLKSELNDIPYDKGFHYTIKLSGDSYGDYIKTYKASNAFGASVEVDSYKGQTQNLVLWKTDRPFKPDLKLSPNCKADPELLRAAGDLLNIEFLVQPKPPFIFSDTENDVPTLNSPLEREISRKHIVGQVLAAKLKYHNSNTYLDCNVIIEDK